MVGWVMEGVEQGDKIAAYENVHGQAPGERFYNHHDGFVILYPPLSLSLGHTHTHTHARTHARTHAN